MPRIDARFRRGNSRGNTSRTPIQEEGMTTALPQTIAPPFAYRDAPPRAGRFIREETPPVKTSIKGRSQQLAFQLFVDENRHLFTDYIQRRLDGPHKNAAEDALQEGLMKIWNQWEDWPTDPEQQIRFARQSLKFAALEAVRKRTGRDGSPRAGEVVVDFQDLDSPLPKTLAAERLARDLGRAIAEGSLVKDQIGYLEKASLVAAIATLTDLEQRVLFMTARGDDCKEIAEDLGVTHQQTREALMRARRLCRMLIEHADGQKVSEKEARLLWQYRDGELSGKRARELKRHVAHCTACQRLIGLEESVEKAGMHVFLPIPLLLLAAGKPAAVAAGVVPGTSAASSTAAGAGSAASVMGTGGSGGVKLGQTILAAQVPTAFTGSVTAGVTAKIGLALGTLAAAGSMGGIYKIAHDKQEQREATRAPAAKVVSVKTTPAVVKSTHPPATTPASVKKAAAKKKTASKKAKAATTMASSKQSRQTNTTSQSSRQSSAPSQSTSQPKNTPSSKSGSGGEFVIGNR